MNAVMSAVNPLYASIFTIATSMYAILNWVNTQWLSLIAKLDLLSHASFGGTLNISPLGLLDTFVPLHEALSYFSAWLAILVTATTIRIIKSFIPAIAT